MVCNPISYVFVIGLRTFYNITRNINKDFQYLRGTIGIAEQSPTCSASICGVIWNSAKKQNKLYVGISSKQLKCSKQLKYSKPLKDSKLAKCSNTWKRIDILLLAKSANFGPWLTNFERLRTWKNDFLYFCLKMVRLHMRFVLSFKRVAYQVVFVYIVCNENVWIFRVEIRYMYRWLERRMKPKFPIPHFHPFPRDRKPLAVHFSTRSHKISMVLKSCDVALFYMRSSYTTEMSRHKSIPPRSSVIIVSWPTL